MMSSTQHEKKPQLLWLDLEMTGLNIATDQILECAALLTDNELVAHATFDTKIVHCDEQYLAAMDEWCQTTHTKSGLVSAVRASTYTITQLEQDLLAFITEYADKQILLCGNSIYQDRLFVARFLPRVYEKLHYRMIDVSSIKEWVRRRYPNSSYAFFKKPETHRAMADIESTIAELKHYDNYFFIPRD